MKNKMINSLYAVVIAATIGGCDKTDDEVVSFPLHEQPKISEEIGESLIKKVGEYFCERESDRITWAVNGDKRAYSNYHRGSCENCSELQYWNMSLKEAMKVIRACEKVFEKKTSAEKPK